MLRHGAGAQAAQVMPDRYSIVSLSRLLEIF
jgi:hypothetical protein